jgi:glycerol-3-phosphate dehydrogenase
VEQLLERYGTRAESLVAALNASGDTPLNSLPGYSIQEIAYLVRAEQAVRLDDILLRRTTLAFTGDLNPERVRELATAAAGELGWDGDRTESEISRAWQILADNHGVVVEEMAV